MKMLNLLVICCLIFTFIVISSTQEAEAFGSGSVRTALGMGLAVITVPVWGSFRAL